MRENGNHFLRLTSTRPGKTVMLYREIAIPEGVEAIRFTWRQRVTNLKCGSQSWFDARIMLEFMDAGRQKLGPSPSAPYSRKDTAGWQQKRSDFLVSEGARTLKFMPCLFNVQAGVFDLDDLQLAPTDATTLRAKAEAAAANEREKTAREAKARGAKAARVLVAEGSLIPNGGFERSSRSKGIPDEWGALTGGTRWQVEDGNRFLRLESLKPGELYMVYRRIDLPANVRALELTWRQRVTRLKKGANPWCDARIMMEFLDANGKKMKGKPSPPYTQRDTKGWVEQRTRFLVPEGAAALEFMPSLFQARAGVYDLDDFVLQPTDPEPLRAAVKKREAEIAARHVPDEAPRKANWPKPLKVVGNRLRDPDGNEVWLQGVNAGGLETLPMDEQPVKSTVVAIDDWKANCVRLPMQEEFWYGRSAYQKDGGKSYRERIDKIVTLAANRGAYLVIDLHRFRAPRQEHADFWKDCATRFKNHPAVLFDIFNEPHGISWDVWKDGGVVGVSEKNDESAFLSEEEKRKNRGFQSVGMQGLIDTVRSTGAKNIIIAGGVFWCNDLSGVTKGYALDDRGGNGIVYSWHTYNWHTGWADKVLAAAERYPIFLGEVGADIKKLDFIPHENQENPYTWAPDMLGFIQKHRINWTGWCFHPQASPIMILDWSYTPTPFWGVFAKEALSGKRFEMKRMR